ncbi:MAG: hypothetical protein WDN28_15625 [Chthoniobacter sp.]
MISRRTSRSIWGSAGVNKLDVTGGGTLATGSAILNTTATSSWPSIWPAAGSSWTQSQFAGSLTTQFGGAGTATFTVSDHAVFSFAQNSDFGTYSFSCRRHRHGGRPASRSAAAAASV